MTARERNGTIVVIGLVLRFGLLTVRGECAPGGTFRSPGETYRQCVERIATLATMVDLKCNAQHVKDKLNECMGTCH